MSITDPVATDGTLVHIVVRDGDGLPEHWVFGTNSTTNPAAPMAVNVYASEAAPDFDIVMSNPALATFVAVGSPGADVIDASGGAGQSSPHLRPISILGLGGADALTGGGADDTIDGGPGDDAIDGGPGVDMADYVELRAPGLHRPRGDRTPGRRLDGARHAHLDRVPPWRGGGRPPARDGCEGDARRRPGGPSRPGAIVALARALGRLDAAPVHRRRHRRRPDADHGGHAYPTTRADPATTPSPEPPGTTPSATTPATT